VYCVVFGGVNSPRSGPELQFIFRTYIMFLKTISNISILFLTLGGNIMHRDITHKVSNIWTASYRTERPEERLSVMSIKEICHTDQRDCNIYMNFMVAVYCNMTLCSMARRFFHCYTPTNLHSSASQTTATRSLYVNSNEITKMSS
jgi:hypothetical protein